VIITENGFPMVDVVARDGRIHDLGRCEMLARYLQALHRAIAEGVPVEGYFHWSLMDNFEWQEGYRHRFGLVHIKHATARRTLKDSAHYYCDIIASDRAGARRRLAAAGLSGRRGTTVLPATAAGRCDARVSITRARIKYPWNTSAAATRRSLHRSPYHPVARRSHVHGTSPARHRIRRARARLLPPTAAEDEVIHDHSLAAIDRSGHVGLGLALIDPFGVTGKVFLSNHEALELTVGDDGHEDLVLQLTWQHHFPELWELPRGALPLYVGVDGRLAWIDDDHHHDHGHDHGEDLGIGVRVPVGVAWWTHRHPIEVFGEVAPLVEVEPDSDFDLTAVIGARYFF